ncbi:MAG: hypothetical protein Q6K55_01360 [Thermostichus sp. DG02_3_bins_51]
MTIQSIVEEILRTRCFTSQHETLIHRLLYDRCFDDRDLLALTKLTEAMIQGVVLRREASTSA